MVVWETSSRFNCTLGQLICAQLLLRCCLIFKLASVPYHSKEQSTTLQGMGHTRVIPKSCMYPLLFSQWELHTRPGVRKSRAQSFNPKALSQEMQSVHFPHLGSFEKPPCTETPNAAFGMLSKARREKNQQRSRLTSSRVHLKGPSDRRELGSTPNPS